MTVDFEGRKRGKKKTPEKKTYKPDPDNAEEMRIFNMSEEAAKALYFAKKEKKAYEDIEALFKEKTGGSKTIDEEKLEELKLKLKAFAVQEAIKEHEKKLAAKKPLTSLEKEEERVKKEDERFDRMISVEERKAKLWEKKRRLRKMGYDIKRSVGEKGGWNFFFETKGSKQLTVKGIIAAGILTGFWPALFVAGMTNMAQTEDAKAGAAPKTDAPKSAKN